MSGRPTRREEVQAALDAEQRAISWPAGVRALVADPLPDWPDVLPPWASVFVTETASNMGASLAMLTAFVLGALSAAAAGRLRVSPWAGWREVVTLYIGMVLSPGGRKTHGFREALQPIHAFEARLQEQEADAVESAKADRSIAEKRLERCKRVASESKNDDERKEAAEEARELQRELSVPAPSLPRLVTTDPTPEAFVRVLSQQNERLTVATAETAFFGQANGRYSPDPAIEAYLSAYDAERIVIDRVSRPDPLVLRGPIATVCLGMQPSVVASVRTTPLRGLLERFCWIVPDFDPRTVPVDEPTPIDPEIAATYEHELTRIMTACRASEATRILSAGSAIPEPWTLTLDAEAKALFVRCRRKIRDAMAEGGALDGLDGWAAKADGRLLRIAGLLHVAWGCLPNQPIDAQTIRAAYKLVTVLAAHARRALLDPPEVPLSIRRARALVRWIQDRSAAEPRERFTTRDAHVALRGERPALSKDDVLAVLEALVRHDYLRPLDARERVDQQWWAAHPCLFLEAAHSDLREAAE